MLHRQKARTIKVRELTLSDFLSPPRRFSSLVDWVEPPLSLCIALLRPLKTSLEFASDMLVESGTNVIPDSASSSQQEQCDASSDDLTELGSEVSEEDRSEEDASEEDASEDDESEGNGSEASFMVDSVDSSESEVIAWMDTSKAGPGEDGSEDDGSESSYMVDSVDSLELEV